MIEILSHRCTANFFTATRVREPRGIIIEVVPDLLTSQEGKTNTDMSTPWCVSKGLVKKNIFLSNNKCEIVGKLLNVDSWMSFYTIESVSKCLVRKPNIFLSKNK